MAPSLLLMSCAAGAAHIDGMSIFSIPADAAEHLPAETKAFTDAKAVYDEAEAHYGYMRTMGAEDDYVIKARSEDPYALNLASRIAEARDQYRADCAAARTEYKAALQAKTDAYICLRRALNGTPEAKAA